jgi:8-oxo-dGTP diphosphatase
MPAPRLTYCSVTNFLCVGDEFLFVHRGAHTKVDANRLNGIGGKLEPGENYIDAAIRETFEETGYKVDVKDVHFAGLGRLEGGYQEDWIVAFFRIDVATKDIPTGAKNVEGELLWLHKDDALKTGHELVDDLKLVFPMIAEHQAPFFFSAILDEKEKILSHTLQQLAK